MSARVCRRRCFVIVIELLLLLVKNEKEWIIKSFFQCSEWMGWSAKKCLYWNSNSRTTRTIDRSTDVIVSLTRLLFLFSAPDSNLSNLYCSPIIIVNQFCYTANYSPTRYYAAQETHHQQTKVTTSIPGTLHTDGESIRRWSPLGSILLKETFVEERENFVPENQISIAVKNQRRDRSIVGTSPSTITSSGS